MRKLLSLIIITITALGQSQTNEIDACQQDCYSLHVKKPVIMGNEEKCSATKSFVTCAKYECKRNELSPDMKHNLENILRNMKRANFNCDIKS